MEVKYPQFCGYFLLTFHYFFFTILIGEYMENNNNVFQIKCPNCSSNDIELNISHGKLRCKYCGTEFNDSKFNEKYQDPTNIQGTNLSRGTEAINVDNQLVMEKCLNCGAEITFRKEDEKTYLLLEVL